MRLLYLAPGVKCLFQVNSYLDAFRPISSTNSEPIPNGCSNNSGIFLSVFIYVFQVSEELIRVAILWHELWHEGLEEASRLYFSEGNVKGMFSALEPLHQMMERGPQTLKETSFNQVAYMDFLYFVPRRLINCNPLHGCSACLPCSPMLIYLPRFFRCC